MNSKTLKLGLLTVTAVLAMGATQLGGLLKLDKPASLGTCDAVTVGSLATQLGGAAEGDTKLCFCKSDGAGSPAYQWCSITLTGASNVVCAGGSTTVCP